MLYKEYLVFLNKRVNIKIFDEFCHGTLTHCRERYHSELDFTSELFMRTLLLGYCLFTMPAKRTSHAKPFNFQFITLSQLQNDN